MTLRAARILFLLTMSLVPPATARSAIVTQHFPANGPVGSRDTQWRVEWGIESHAGGSETLVIRNAWFSRARGEAEVHVLGDTRLADIFVPYFGGTRIYDISNFNFKVVDLTKGALGPPCIQQGHICDRDGRETDKGPVAIEVHDDLVRWMDTHDRVRRGQKLQIWCTLNAANYRYVMLYEFGDDGVVGVRLGPTASNLFSRDDDAATHIHAGLWRITPVLDDAAALKIGIVEMDTNAFKTVVRPVKIEADQAFDPAKFTKVRIESTKFRNAHNPANFISYELVPRPYGTGRYTGVGEEFTRSDFWFTRADPSELRPRDLLTYSNGEPIDGVPTTLWHMASAQHIARDEDFGATGYTSSEGLAITTWAGFDLKPRNFFAKTPLFP